MISRILVSSLLPCFLICLFSLSILDVCCYVLFSAVYSRLSKSSFTQSFHLSDGFRLVFLPDSSYFEASFADIRSSIICPNSLLSPIYLHRCLFIAILYPSLAHPSSIRSLHTILSHRLFPTHLFLIPSILIILQTFSPITCIPSICDTSSHHPNHFPIVSCAIESCSSQLHITVKLGS